MTADLAGERIQKGCGRATPCGWRDHVPDEPRAGRAVLGGARLVVLVFGEGGPGKGSGGEAVEAVGWEI